jgi:hypothetical protein
LLWLCLGLLLDRCYISVFYPIQGYSQAYLSFVSFRFPRQIASRGPLRLFCPFSNTLYIVASCSLFAANFNIWFGGPLFRRVIDGDCGRTLVGIIWSNSGWQWLISEFFHWVLVEKASQLRPLFLCVNAWQARGQCGNRWNGKCLCIYLCYIAADHRIIFRMIIIWVMLAMSSPVFRSAYWFWYLSKCFTLSTYHRSAQDHFFRCKSYITWSID